LHGGAAPDSPVAGSLAPEAATTAGLFREASGSAHRAPRGGGLAAEARHPAWQGAPDELQPLALYDKDGGLMRIRAACERARLAGLVPGLSLAEARARFPFVRYEEMDRGADAALLAAIADWCDRYTPLVALDGPSGLFLDISGCAHLFGGEDGLMRDLAHRMEGQGLAAGLAIASSAGPAAALAVHAPGTVTRPGEEVGLLAPLPCRALRFEPALSATLDRLGLRRVGELLSMPRASLGRRFGAAFMEQLDFAIGRSTRPLNPRRPVPALIYERRLFEPIGRVEDIENLILHLAQRLKPDLERLGQGVRQLELSLFRVDGVVERIALATARPMRDPASIRRLFCERLKAIGDERDAGYGYDLLRLSVLSMDVLDDDQSNFLASGVTAERMVTLVDRLTARLGPGAVQSLQDVASHWPEKAQALVAGFSGTAAATDTAMECLPRPLRILDPPEPVEAISVLPEGEPIRFVWRRAAHRVLRLEGPERIEPEWWHDDVTTATPGLFRDYFRIEDDAGRRYWMFREGLADMRPARWFLHGIFP